LGAHWSLLWFRGSKSNCISGLLPIVRITNYKLALGAVAHLWAPISKFTPGAYAHFGAYLGRLVFRGPKSNSTLRGNFLLQRITNLKLTPGAFAHFGGPLGHFVV
jgi:hypothetical protein